MELGEVPPERQIVKDALSVAWPSVLESFFVNLAGVGGYHHGGIAGLLRHCGGGLDHTAKVFGPGCVYITECGCFCYCGPQKRGGGSGER